jgi:hypothetical protein
MGEKITTLFWAMIFWGSGVYVPEIIGNKRKNSKMGFHQRFIFIFTLFFIIRLFTCAYIVWVISPSYPCTHPLPRSHSLPGRTCSTLFSSSVEE